ncbi:putative mitochondrial carrier [Wickerhamomyces ciferrii]|uniref:Mitochondrial carrier n=1 Tax=Wickerhamomyces ciferrii (strain ATCC 14091 / BCRC 22168 / CBS 111 / JCM 3599 / NBRC 0793 / NRRL Y-1031 F-60-10) TaxID=1206466 RepID=K0KHQ8_WICCF|nr:putative mitochondrial carrier [Wickerhamomyces ciferrii]CCH40914.1 putative mitochondrial carrier [Wickerhamomyces ciferrii]
MSTSQSSLTNGSPNDITSSNPIPSDDESFLQNDNFKAMQSAPITKPIVQQQQQHNHKVKDLISPNWSNTQIIALSGAFAGFIAGVSVCPLDVAKTRLQAQGLSSIKKYHGIKGTLKTIFNEEGVRGLYRGLSPIILGYFPTWMIYFSVYEKAKIFYPNFFDKHYGINHKDNEFHEFLIHSLSAFTAGSVSTSITNPIWVVKTRLMLQTGDGKISFNSNPNTTTTGNTFQHDNYYKNTFDAFRKMYKNEGFLVFYSGLIPSLFGLFHVAIHFPVYEKLKKILNVDKFQSQSLKQDDQNHNSNLLRLIMASSLSKMCASTLTYPHEILRTRMQIKSFNSTSSNSLINTIINIYKKEGSLGFYQGFTTNLTRTVPASAVTLVSFEYISKYLTRVLKEPSYPLKPN